MAKGAQLIGINPWWTGPRNLSENGHKALATIDLVVLEIWGSLPTEIHPEDLADIAQQATNYTYQIPQTHILMEGLEDLAQHGLIAPPTDRKVVALPLLRTRYYSPRYQPPLNVPSGQVDDGLVGSQRSHPHQRRGDVD